MFIQSKVWTGGEGSGDSLDLGPSLGHCTKEKPKEVPDKSKSPRSTGTVARFNSDRGFGFIVPDTTGPDIFVHITELQSACIDRLVRGDRLSYEVVNGRDGKPAAVNIEESR